MINKKNKNILGILILIISIISANYYITEQQFKKRFAWVNLSKIYNEFSLKKDLEKKLMVVETARKKITDSLELELKVMVNQFELLNDAEKNNQSTIFQIKKQEYLTKKQEFDEDNEQLKTDYHQQVLTQINQYVKDYATGHNYSMIYGADGSGVLMYAEEKIEITNEVLLFVNNKYKGEETIE
jgi:outer membrane protein